MKPMVKAVAGHPALAAWDIINEPEALVYNNKADTNLCFDTRPLVNTGAGWVGKWIPMQQYAYYHSMSA
jgi:mannan endo-1,4-beta-mannosidase